MRFTIVSLAALSLASSSLAAVVPRWHYALSCSDLWQAAPKMLPNLEVYIAEDVAAGSTLPANSPFSTPAYNQAVPDLPAFCRFGAYIHTSNMSKVQFEVWLPDVWSGRYAMVGNGGDAGGVNFPDMWAPLTKYNMVVASTDTGHNGTAFDPTFAINNPESQIDFGYRAVHLTTEYSKTILAAYYGKKQDYSYWLGCSSGGKQGLKEVQMFPHDYDGVVAGAAAQWYVFPSPKPAVPIPPAAKSRSREASWPHLNGYTYAVNAIVNPIGSAGHLNATDYATIAAEVMKQCDTLDGVQDGILTNAQLCHPDLSPLLCSAPNANATSCLSQAKIDTMKNIWGNWTAQTDAGYPKGTFLFPGFAVGAESNPFFSVTGQAFPPGPGYFQYQILNYTNPAVTYSGNESQTEYLVKLADEIDPGMTNAEDPNIGEFLKHGKLLTYVGGADVLIPTYSTTYYRKLVADALGNDNLDDTYRTFIAPGVSHCSGGRGADGFGGPGQRQDSLGGQSQPLVYDAHHDMTLAMFDWVEKGKAPDYIIAAKYNNNNKTQGVAFTRPLCPYPQFAKYIGGNTTEASSFECAYDW
ncbi:hypothetical protein BMF94_1566 [Rhodotorula taiwanensis]|uniref:Carboxylic ester hydrolase n=1 Tax=Rhodotorula taiwanensis TaxID=741276 RepID=A0A2S5BEY5_9BASI|nr:hypothetical protein BMF94_1566 [Rhodotorula taiwanensis]